MRPSVCLAAVVIVIGLALVGSPVQAQTPPIPPTPPPATPPLGLRDPQTGDIVWDFAPEFPFFDTRVAMALAWTMAPTTGTTQGTPVLPASPDLRRGIRPGDAALLMEAAGMRARPGSLNQPPPLKVIGACRIWIAPASAGVAPSAPLDKSAESIGTAFVQALRDLLGVTVAPCTTTTNAAQAQIFVWTQGGPAPAYPSPMRQTSTLLAAEGSQARPPLAGGVGGGPLPAKTGNAGAEGGSVASITVLVALIGMAAAVFVARARVRRTG